MKRLNYLCAAAILALVSVPAPALAQEATDTDGADITPTPLTIDDIAAKRGQHGWGLVFDETQISNPAPATAIWPPSRDPVVISLGNGRTMTVSGDTYGHDRLPGDAGNGLRIGDSGNATVTTVRVSAGGDGNGQAEGLNK